MIEHGRTESSQLSLPQANLFGTESHPPERSGKQSGIDANIFGRKLSMQFLVHPCVLLRLQSWRLTSLRFAQHLAPVLKPNTISYHRPRRGVR